MANKGIAPFVLNLSTGWRSVVRFKFQPLYCLRRKPGIELTEGSMGATGPGHFKETEILGPNQSIH
jgi:hypothetical protein